MDYLIINSYNELQKFLEFKKSGAGKCIGFDIETTSLDPNEGSILLMQFNIENRIGIVQVLNSDPIKCKELVKQILEDPYTIKLIHNAKFEYKWLKSIGITINNMFDTMVAEQIIMKGKEGGFYSLENLVYKYSSVELEKETREEFIGHDGIDFTEKQLEYAARDVLYLEDIYQMQTIEMTKPENRDLLKLKDIEMKLTPVLAEIEIAGIKLDVDKFTELYKSNNKKRKMTETKLLNLLEEKLIEKINLELGFDIKSSIIGNYLEFCPFQPNLASPLQLQEIFNVLGLKVDSVAHHQLLKLLLKNDIPEDMKKIINLYQRQVELNKLCSSWGIDYLKHVKEDGRIHAAYNQYITKSSRLSSSRPNLQQLPKENEFRECFIVEKGYKLIKADYDSQELRIIAAVSGDEKLLDDLKNNVDVYSLIASQMYKKNVRKNYNKDLRRNAKIVVLQTNYGATPYGIFFSVGLPVNEAEELQSTYFKSYPTLYKWIQETRLKVLRTGKSKTNFGRERIFELPEMSFENMKGLLDLKNKKLNDTKKEQIKKLKHIMRAGANHKIQGEAAVMMKIALVKLYNQLKIYDSSIVGSIHDEILIEVFEPLVDEVVPIIKDVMSSVAIELVPEIEIPVDVTISDNWGGE